MLLNLNLAISSFMKFLFDNPYVTWYHNMSVKSPDSL